MNKPPQPAAQEKQDEKLTSLEGKPLEPVDLEFLDLKEKEAALLRKKKGLN